MHDRNECFDFPFCIQFLQSSKYDDEYVFRLFLEYLECGPTFFSFWRFCHEKKMIKFYGRLKSFSCFFLSITVVDGQIKMMDLV